MIEEVVTWEMIDAVIARLEAEFPAQSNGKPYREFNIEEFLKKHGINVKRAESYNGGRRFILENCAFDASHNGTSVAVIEMPSGALQYCCQHSSCATKKWPDFRELFEPGYRAQQHTNGKGKQDNSAGIRRASFRFRR